MKVNTKLRTAPAEEPVTLAEMKLYLRVDDSADDALITSLISAARVRIENHISKKIISQKWDVYFDNFPRNYRSSMWWDGVRDMAVTELMSSYGELKLPLGKLISVEEFNTYADDGVAQLFDSSNYVVDTSGPYGRVALKLGVVWPTTVLRPVNGIEIKATFGMFNTAAAVTDDLKTAIKSFVAQMYEHRGDENPKIPPAALMLLEPYKEYNLGC